MELTSDQELKGDQGKSNTGSAERKAGWILFGIAATEGVWVAMNWMRNGLGFIRYLGFAPGRYGSAWGWLAAIVVTALFVCQSVRLPSVRQNLFRLSGLKMLGLAVAVV